MRLTYMYYLMKNNFDALKNLKIIEDDKMIAGKREYYGQIKNWLCAKEALENVSSIPFCSEIADMLLTHPDLQLNQDEFRIPVDTYNELCLPYYNFTSRMSGVIEFCKSIGLDEHEYGFDVKLPPTDDFNELIGYMTKFQKLVLSCPYLKSTNEKITLLKSDIGSIWLCFGVATGVATATPIIINNLQKIKDKSIKIKSHKLTCEAQEAQLRAMQQKEDVIKSVVQGFEEYKKILLDQCVEELENEAGRLKNGEERTATAKAIETLGDLMAKGLEIYTAIDPSAISAQDLFPTSDEIKNLPTPAKLLTGEVDDGE